MSDDIIVTTMNDLPGYEVTEVFGEVFGLTVRSRHVGTIDESGAARPEKNDDLLRRRRASGPWPSTRHDHDAGV